jgi:hypothetical protein
MLTTRTLHEVCKSPRVTNMKTKHVFILFIGAAVCFCAEVDAAAVALHPGAVTAWNRYVQLTEDRIAHELNGGPEFLLMDSSTATDGVATLRALHEGRIYVQKMKTREPDGHDIEVPEGMIHYWYGAVFVPNVRLETLLKFIQDYAHHRDYFPEVEQSRLLSHDGNAYRIFLQLTRTKIVTVHYKTFHTVEYRSYGDGQESSRSVATQILQLQNAGAADEKALPEGQDDGYFWRLNSYWRFKEKDHGVVVECESISLSRSIPFGFGWLIGAVVESVPRESLENALQTIRDRLR